MCLGTKRGVVGVFKHNIVHLRHCMQITFHDNVGPVPDPWTIPRPILATFDNKPLILQFNVVTGPRLQIHQAVSSLLIRCKQIYLCNAQIHPPELEERILLIS